MVHQPHHNGNGGKGKGKKNKPKQAITFKKKKKENEGCFVCGSIDHWAKKCRHRKGRKPPQQKTASMETIAGEENRGYRNLPSIFSAFQSTNTWWLDTGANVHVCADASLFSSYQVAWDSSVLMGNRSHASVLGVEVHFGKDCAAEAACPFYQ